MPIDTRDKRASVLGWGLPLGSPLPNPDSSIGASERKDINSLYSGVAIAVNWNVRASMVGLNLPMLRPPGPYPDGSLSADDRQMIRGLYYNIHTASPSGTALVISHTIGMAIGRSLGRSV